MNAAETDPDVAAKIKAHLESRWRRSCDCGGTNWSVDIFVVLALSEKPDKLAQLNLALVTALPCAAIVCVDCGLTKFLNLKTAKIVP